MVRLMCLTQALAVAVGISDASAQTGGTVSATVRSMAGVVKRVSASSLTLERDGHEIMFALDSSTRVLAKARPRDYRNPERKRTLTDIVKAGDQVTVRYRQSGSAMNAVEIRVLQSREALHDVTPPTPSGIRVRREVSERVSGLGSPGSETGRVAIV